jgi:hypothetical protein
VERSRSRFPADALPLVRFARITDKFLLWIGLPPSSPTSRTKGSRLVRFYGRYSNVCQGRKKRQAGCAVQLLAEQAQDDDYLLRKQCRSNWARLIKKIYQTDPLVCPKCQGPMTIISFLEDPGNRQKNSASSQPLGGSRTLLSTGCSCL